MAYNTSRRMRERRLRAKYRKRVWTAAIVMLIVGLILGVIACVVGVQKSDRVAQLLNLGPQGSMKQVLMTTAEPTATPAPTEEIVSTPTLAINQLDQAPVSVLDGESEVAPVGALDGETDVSPLSAENDFADADGFVPGEEPGVEADFDADANGAMDVAPAMLSEPEASEAPAIAAAPIETPEATAAPEVTVAAEATAAPEASAMPETAAVPEATAAPAAEATPSAAPEPVIVPYGETRNIQTQIGAEGKARESMDEQSYETLDISMRVTAYKDFDYYEQNYGDTYDLQGGTAAVEIEMTLNGYAGTAEIIPQDAMTMTLRGENEGDELPGYQLIDKEIAGKVDVKLVNDQPVTLYKRYPYTEKGEMRYLVVSTYVDGVSTVYWFDLVPPEGAEPEAAESENAGVELTVGSKGDDVRKLQRVLIDNGLLSGEPDGHFGNYTAEAVREMQRRFDMEPTGVADQAFLDRLYEEN